MMDRTTIRKGLPIMRTAFQPQLEQLEDRVQMSTMGPISPLAGQMQQAAVYAYAVFKAVDNAYSTPSQVGIALQYERNLENTVRLYETAERYYEGLGYCGTTFWQNDASFHAIDQAVMQAAAWWQTHHVN
jgi:hypothetical protein